MSKCRSRAYLWTSCTQPAQPAGPASLASQQAHLASPPMRARRATEANSHSTPWGPICYAGVDDFHTCLHGRTTQAMSCSDRLSLPTFHNTYLLLICFLCPYLYHHSSSLHSRILYLIAQLRPKAMTQPPRILSLLRTAWTAVGIKTNRPLMVPVSLGLFLLTKAHPEILCTENKAAQGSQTYCCVE